MPDPSEPSRDRPDGQGHSTPAPKDLRRRVLARVRGEPEFARSSLLHPRQGVRRGAILSGAGALILLGVLASVFAGGSQMLGHTRISGVPGRARADLQRVGGHAELLLSGMPQPPLGEIYEVWLSGPTPALRPTNALFNVTSAGRAEVEVPGSLAGVREVTVTAEPIGGSSHPSSPVIITVALPGSH